MKVSPSKFTLIMELQRLLSNLLEELWSLPILALQLACGSVCFACFVYETITCTFSYALFINLFYA